MSEISHHFPEIEATLNAMTAKNTLLGESIDMLETEMNKWSAGWEGTAHTQAVEWTTRVISAARHTHLAAQQYIAKGHVANGDMQTTEATNQALWT